jgi:selenocysteine lyase/cysteine desulfurase
MNNSNFGSKDLFNLKDSTFFTNHGSYGSCPKIIHDKKSKLLLELESEPDRWFRFKSKEYWNKSISSLSEYLNINSENLVICQNATESVNVALKSITFKSDHAILAHTYTYGAILNSIDYIAKYRLDKEIPVFKVACEFPIKSENDILDEFEKTCKLIVEEKGLKLRLSVIDHISSATAMVYPLKKINAIIRKWSRKTEDIDEDRSIIIVDGAHAIGQIKINLLDLDCDFYTSNLHKWFLSPKTCSFLFVRNPSNFKVQPNYISWGYSSKDIGENFFMRGTFDQTSWYVVDDCIKFYEIILGGLESITKYNTNLIERAVDFLCDKWSTKRNDIPKFLEAPFMRLIKMPKMKSYMRGINDEETTNVCVKLIRDILDKFNVVSCMVCVQGEIFCRISCFVYNKMEDYEKLGEAVQALIDV